MLSENYLPNVCAEDAVLCFSCGLSRQRFVSEEHPYLVILIPSTASWHQETHCPCSATSSSPVCTSPRPGARRTGRGAGPERAGVAPLSDDSSCIRRADSALGGRGGPLLGVPRPEPGDAPRRRPRLRPTTRRCGPLRGVPRLFPQRRLPGKRTRIRAPGPRLLTTFHFFQLKRHDQDERGSMGRHRERRGQRLHRQVQEDSGRRGRGSLSERTRHGGPLRPPPPLPLPASYRGEPLLLDLVGG